MRKEEESFLHLRFFFLLFFFAYPITRKRCKAQHSSLYTFDTQFLSLLVFFRHSYIHLTCNIGVIVERVKQRTGKDARARFEHI